MGMFKDLQGNPTVSREETRPTTAQALAAAEIGSKELARRDALPGIASDEQERLQRGTPRGTELYRRMIDPPEVTAERLAAYLQHLSEVPNSELAAFKAGLLHSQIERLQRADPGFASAISTAKAVACGEAEAEAFRRAVRGIEKNVFYQDRVIDTVHEFSDSLMGKVLEANVDRYERKTNVKAEIDIQMNWLQLVQHVHKIDSGSNS